MAWVSVSVMFLLFSNLFQVNIHKYVLCLFKVEFQVINYYGDIIKSCFILNIILCTNYITLYNLSS